MKEILDSYKPWMDDARCANIENPDIFFPPRDKTAYKRIANEAKDYCLGPNRNNPCPVRNFCLLQAVEEDEQHGIWGGLSHRERNAMVRKWHKKYRHEMTLVEYINQLDKRA